MYLKSMICIFLCARTHVREKLMKLLKEELFEIYLFFN